MSDIDTTHFDQADVLMTVQRYATTDRDFRKRLLNEPHEVLTEVTGQALPEDFTIRFIEKDKGTDALVVLADMVPETMELSGEELESMVGECLDTCWFFTDACWLTDLEI